MIHSDASVDFAGDGSFLVTLVPSNLPMTTVVGVYGMSKATRGQGCDFREFLTRIAAFGNSFVQGGQFYMLFERCPTKNRKGSLGTAYEIRVLLFAV